MTTIELEALTAIKNMAKEFSELNKNLSKLIEVLTQTTSTNEKETANSTSGI